MDSLQFELAAHVDPRTDTAPTPDKLAKLRDSIATLLVRQELPRVRETLIALGYRDVLLAAKPLRELSQEKREKFAALAVGAPSSMRLLDMKA